MAPLPNGKLTFITFIMHKIPIQLAVIAKERFLSHWGKSGSNSEDGEKSLNLRRIKLQNRHSESNSHNKRVRSKSPRSNSAKRVVSPRSLAKNFKGKVSGSQNRQTLLSYKNGSLKWRNDDWLPRNSEIHNFSTVKLTEWQSQVWRMGLGFRPSLN